MIDPKLYRQALEFYRQWNEAELKAQANNAQKATPLERWQQYQALWQFCMELAGPPSEIYLRQHLADWSDYYAKVQQFEAWKKQNAA